MSHFTVGVFVDGTKSLEQLLAPYQENNMDDCPKEYLEFNDVTESEMEDYKCISDEIKIKYPTFESYIENYCGYKKDIELGKYGYWGNPNRKWDWWQIGGRWSYSLLVKNDSEKVIDSFSTNGVPFGYVLVDAAKVKDIEFTLMVEKSRLKYENLWEESQKEENIAKHFLYGIQKYDIKESYVNRNTEFSTCAVITADGKWHEKGEMGWWGISSETKEELEQWNKSYYDTFFKNTNTELVFVVVDCHI